jgi:hypothetical protein
MGLLPRLDFFLQRTTVENIYQLVVVRWLLDAVVPKPSQSDPDVHNYISKFGTRSERRWVGMGPYRFPVSKINIPHKKPDFAIRGVVV